MVGEERRMVDDIVVRGVGRGIRFGTLRACGCKGRDLPPGRVIRSGGVPLRGCLGGGRAAAGVGVIDFERAELDTEAGVQSRR